MKKYYLIILLFLIAINAWGQSDIKLSSYEGRHFVLGFMLNEIAVTEGLGTDVHATLRLELYVSATQKASINVRVGSGSSFYSIPADSMLILNFNRDLMITNSEDIVSKTIDIQADVPITIYGLNSIETSSDIFSAIPVTNWGKEYRIVSYGNDTYKDNPDINPIWAAIPRRSQFLVVSAFDSTDVTITPSYATAMGHPAGSPFTVRLNKGNAYLVQSQSIAEGGDLSGSIVKSNYPVGVFSGHVRTAITHSMPYPLNSKDHLVEMLMPTESWGKNFITTPFIIQEQTQATLYRIVPLTANTNINIVTNSGLTYNLNLSQIDTAYEVNYIHEPAVWSADSPIQIAQMMSHTNTEKDNVYYDPSMMINPAIEQYVPKMVFLAPKNNQRNPQQFVAHFAQLIADTMSLSSLRLDGRLLTSFTNIETSRIIGTKYNWARIPVSAGIHIVTADTGKFSGVLYGYGEYDSYAVVLGSSLIPPNVIDTIPPLFVVDTLCGTLNGFAFEKSSDNSSGIDFCNVVESQTINYIYSVTGYSDTATVFNFSAYPEKEDLEGLFTLVIRDKKNNYIRYIYRYFPILFNVSPSNITPGDIDWKDSLCYDIKIKNNSKIPIEVKDINCGDSRVYLHHAALPIKIEVGKEYHLRVCIAPHGDFSILNTVVNISFDCGKFSKIPIKGFISAADIEAKGFDFGDVLVEEDSCAFVYIANNGNLPITFTKFEFSEESTAYNYDTLGLLPKTIPPGDTLFIPVCFLPKERRDYKAVFSITNSLGLPNSIEIKGSGISADLGELYYDFGHVRAGTMNTHRFKIKNTGNANAKIDFSNIELNNSHFDISEFQSINTLLIPNAELDFDVRYNPQVVGKDSLKAYYILNNDAEKKFSLILVGNATLPEIETYDSQFAEIDVFSMKDDDFDIIKSGGNEELSIKSIQVISGDTQQFTYDLTAYQNIKIKPDSILHLPIRYNPNLVGSHSLTFEVVSDAALNYTEVKNQFIITASAKPVDTTNIGIGIKSVEDVQVCNEYYIYPFVYNTGNVDLTLQSFMMTSPIDGRDITWIESLENPRVLSAGDSAIFKLRHLTSTNDSIGTISFKAETDKGISKEIDYNYYSPIKRLEAVVLQDFSFNPNDTINISFSGKLPHKTSIPVDIEIVIYLEEENFKLLTPETELIIEKNNEIIKIPLVLEQKNNYIKFLIKRQIENYFDDVLWKLDLKFYTYLSGIKSSKISAFINSPECFYSDSSSANAEMLAVCVDGGRTVEYIKMPEINSIIYSDMSDELICDIDIIERDNLSFSLFSSNGELLFKESDLKVDYGKKIYSVDMSKFSSGVYIFSLKCNYFVKNLVFIKNK